MPVILSAIAHNQTPHDGDFILTFTSLALSVDCFPGFTTALHLLNAPGSIPYTDQLRPAPGYWQSRWCLFGNTAPCKIANQNLLFPLFMISLCLKIPLNVRKLQNIFLFPDFSTTYWDIHSSLLLLLFCFSTYIAIAIPDRFLKINAHTLHDSGKPVKNSTGLYCAGDITSEEWDLRQTSPTNHGSSPVVWSFAIIACFHRSNDW